MSVVTEGNNRVLIFFFYDGDGIVDDYVLYNLKGFRPYARNMIFVCNGKLTDESRNKLAPCVDKVILRENKGFDGWAYKTGIDDIGWEALSEYDELIMTNHTIMGPVGSYQEMFHKMDGKNLDFWGVTKNYAIEYDFTGSFEDGHIPEHIQSHFIAVRRSLFDQDCFHKYWDEFPQINSYGDAIGKHEALFTKHFSDMGYSWQVYVDTDDIRKMCDYPLVNMPVEMLRRGCPFFKRRSFFHEYGHYLEQAIGTAAEELLQYLQEETEYDTNLIWNNILRTCNMEDINQCLHLNYVVASDKSDSESLEQICEKRRVALLMHLYFEDLYDEMYKYASSMPAFADVYITVGDPEKKKDIEDKFASLPVRKVEVILVNNRGRDVSAGLIVGRQLVDQYDYICFAHDKKAKQLKNGLAGQGFADRCFHNVLLNRHVVANILQLFEKHERLGLLGTAFPNHGEYFELYGYEWTQNYKNTEKLLKELGIKVPLNESKQAITAYGSEFWFRTKALRRLYEKEWTYEDFPEEPLPEDGTISHAIERSRGYVAQAAGYYAGFVFSDRAASLEYTNLSFYLREYQRVINNIKTVAEQQGDKEAYTDMSLRGMAGRLLEEQRQHEAIQQYIRELEQRSTLKGVAKRIVYRLFPFMKQKW